MGNHDSRDIEIKELLSDEHVCYRRKMDAWFKEQEAVVESDKIDLAIAEQRIEQFERKKQLAIVQAESNKEQLATDLQMIQAVRDKYNEYLKQFEA